jgi:hypothetical protein
MQYYQIMIFFHRPWVSKSYIQPQNPKQGPGYQHARRTCAESATAIARLLRLYEKHYTFRRINNQVVAIIFTAALMLIFITISMSSQDTSRLHSDEKNRLADMAAHLNVCFRALDELGQSFENAKRTRDFLVSLQRRWQNHMRKNGVRPKRSLEPSARFVTKNQQSALEDRTSATTSTDTSSSSVPGQKKLRLSQSSSILEDSSLSANLLDAHDLLPPEVNFNQLSGGLNWTPTSRDLKMLSEGLGDAPLFSTTSLSPSSTASPRHPSRGDTMKTTLSNGGNNTVPNLDDMVSGWWNWPSLNGVNGATNHRGGTNL